MNALPSKIYDWLKYITIIVIPSLASAYTGLSRIWSLPYASEIPATATVLCTLLGALLCISTAQYNLAQAKEFTDFPENIEE